MAQGYLCSKLPLLVGCFQKLLLFPYMREVRCVGPTNLLANRWASTPGKWAGQTGTMVSARCSGLTPEFALRVHAWRYPGTIWSASISAATLICLILLSHQFWLWKCTISKGKASLFTKPSRRKRTPSATFHSHATAPPKLWVLGKLLPLYKSRETTNQKWRILRKTCC